MLSTFKMVLYRRGRARGGGGGAEAVSAAPVSRRYAVTQQVGHSANGREREAGKEAGKRGGGGGVEPQPSPKGHLLYIRVMTVSWGGLRVVMKCTS